MAEEHGGDVHAAYSEMGQTGAKKGECCWDSLLAQCGHACASKCILQKLQVKTWLAAPWLGITKVDSVKLVLSKHSWTVWQDVCRLHPLLPSLTGFTE